jgi:beta-lactamase class A
MTVRERAGQPGDHTDVAERSLRELAENFSGVLAVAARAEDTGELVTLDPDRVMPTASVIKLAVLAEVFRQAQAGRFSLEERVPLGERNRAGGSGVLKDLSPGLALTVRDYATLMITVSDNTATNTLIDLLGGVDPVNRFVRGQLGLTTITLHRKVSFPGPPEPAGDAGDAAPGGDAAPAGDAEPRPPLGEASPRHLMELVSLMWRGELVSPRASAEMLAILGRQQFLDQAPRLLACDVSASGPDARQGVTVACKTGMVDGTRADAGLLRLRERAVSYAIMTDGCPDTGLYTDHEGMLAGAKAGRILAGRFWPGPGPAPVRPLPRW